MQKLTANKFSSCSILKRRSSISTLAGWTRHGEADSRTRRLCTTVAGEQTAGAARGDVSAGDGIRLGCAGSGRRAWWNGSKVQPADGPQSAKRVWAGVAGGDDHAAVGRN